jgi:endonuclease/exonuclease/phosphatase family metal-dependent hydrolase
MTLRVGTFNARFLPHLLSNARRAAVLAERIREARYDLIVLTEVFSGRARRVLIEALGADYPWNVQYVGSRRIIREDSGLMLLSRLPFDELPASPDYSHPRIRASASGVTPDWPHVWFVEYKDCTASDCLAGKGAAYVRLRFRERPLHVFFTHMQAAYDYHGPEKQARTRQIRTAQLKQMATLVRAALAPDSAARENVLVLGDCNVDGVRSGNGNAGGDEWHGMLAALGEPFPGGLADVWDQHVPADDPGHTFPAWNPHARRDYVFLSSADPTQPLAVQHVALAHDLAEPSVGNVHLSDHIGISVDLNLHQHGCHPADAHAIEIETDGAPVNGTISFPGGLQWYRIVTAGTYEIGLGMSGATASDALTLYAAGDISRPLAPLATGNGDPTQSTQRYRLPEETFIRIGRPKSNLSGAFALRVASAL